MPTAVTIESGRAPNELVRLAGDLTMPPATTEPKGVVLFAHGSGSSRLSPRNQAVASTLQENGFGTLLMDLLTGGEEQIDARTAELRFDIGLLGRRLVDALAHVREHDETSDLPVGLFGASTGAAAALVAAAEEPGVVRAVVSRGGRPDLAGQALANVRAPTLLIVGGRDEQVIDLNRQAMDRLSAEQRLEIVPGATHLFEERGALEQVAELAASWFGAHLTR